MTPATKWGKRMQTFPVTTNNTARHVGICQWFHYQDYASVHRTVRILQNLGVTHLRTGVSWADFVRPEGKAWHDWVFHTLYEAELDLLVSVWHTPPSLSEGATCSSPPRRLFDYADFIEQVIIEYGYAFTHLELWNEPNNRIKWDFRTWDPGWKKFAAMVSEAAMRAKRRGKSTVLGGMIPVDHHWLELIDELGALEHLDVIGIHAFPGMWWDNHAYCWDWKSHWKGWREKIDYISASAGGRPIWVTETGFANWCMDRGQPGMHVEQGERLMEALHAPTERLYWYCALDLAPSRACIEMTEDAGRVDHNEYHLGLVAHDGTRKPSYYLMKQCLRRDGKVLPHRRVSPLPLTTD